MTGKYETGWMLKSRIYDAILMVVVMALGLLLRSQWVDLPRFIEKYGGDALWALLVFFGFHFLFPRWPIARLAAISVAFAWGVEFSQMYHVAWLDEIRATRLGRLVLGTTFHAPDLLAYTLGISIGVGLLSLIGPGKRG
jgi:Protein of unknown function (DUF2809)